MIYLVCREGSNEDRLDTLPQKKEWTIRSVWNKTTLIADGVGGADLMPALTLIVGGHQNNPMPTPNT